MVVIKTIDSTMSWIHCPPLLSRSSGPSSLSLLEYYGKKNNNIICSTHIFDITTMRGRGNNVNNLFTTPPPYEKMTMTSTASGVVAAAYKDRIGGAAAASTIATPPIEAEEERLLEGTSIGVVKFLKGKNLFITGATGFVAKVLIEKLLRTVADVGKIFILVRAKDKEAAARRLKSEIIDLDLFMSLKILHGKSFQAFMLSKLIPVPGNVGEPNLGIESNLANEIAETVDVIVNSSASTTFDERYDVAINTNARGPCRLLSFAKKCKNLSLFLHVSTAYVNVNGERGIISETPLKRKGLRMTNELFSAEALERLSFPDELNIEAELNFASQLKDASGIASSRKMKELGLERANRYGWPNIYAFTKAMGEMMINSQRENIPIVVIRPSIIESAYKEPSPGWIEGNRMMDPLILFYGKGHLPGFLANPKAVVDIVPVDMVVNTALVAMARHGVESKPEINVYHVSTSVSNPILIYDLFKYSYDHFKSSPLMNKEGKQIGVNNMKFFSSMADFSSYIAAEIANGNGAMAKGKLLQRHKMKCEKIESHILNVAKLYEPYMFYTSWFDNAKIRKLINMMSPEEKEMFECDVGIIDWKEYICNIHIPGFRRNVLKGRVMLG